MWILFGILGLALLMVVHESGHYLAARVFKMRVTRFSIGFGPALFRHTPKGSPTTYQVAIIPFFAYVQIAGMNPLEEIDPNDEGSYANASLLGRIVTIFAGPLANYLFASVLFFGALMIGGHLVPTTNVNVRPGSPAEIGQMKTGDKVVEVAGKPIAEWDQMKSVVSANPGKAVDIGVEREGKLVHLTITPNAQPNGEGLIGVEAVYFSRPAKVGEAVSVRGPRAGQCGRRYRGQPRPNVDRQSEARSLRPGRHRARDGEGRQGWARSVLVVPRADFGLPGRFQLVPHSRRSTADGSCSSPTRRPRDAGPIPKSKRKCTRSGSS